MVQDFFDIVQGSTPLFELQLPFEYPSSGAVVFATFVQNTKPVREFALGGTATSTIAGTGTLTVSDSDDSTLLLSLTQADTLAMTPGDVEFQVRIRTSDGADTFHPIPGRVHRAYKPGVI